jgi:hypothetical protein
MAKLTMEEAKDFAVLPEDSILELKIEEVEEREVDGRNGKWTKLSCKFKILGIQAIGDGSPVEEYQSLITETIYGSVPLKLTNSQDNKLRQWAEAILRIDMGLGFELDTAMFKGRMVRGITSVWMKKVGTEQYPRHQVEALLPMAEQQVAQTQQAPASSWGTPGVQTPVATEAAAPAEDPWAAPAGTPQAGDPWGGWGDGDEPPF